MPRKKTKVLTNAGIAQVSESMKVKKRKAYFTGEIIDRRCAQCPRVLQAPADADTVRCGIHLLVETS